MLSSSRQGSNVGVNEEPERPCPKPSNPPGGFPGRTCRPCGTPSFKAPRLERRRERLWLADGDFIDLTGTAEGWRRWCWCYDRLVEFKQQLAASSVAINWRGCSGEPNLLPRAYHSGASDDLAEVIGHLQASRPMAPLHAVGYSLGGNVLLKYLGETGASSPLRKAVAVSVPFRLCADRIGLGFSRVYRRIS